jgi:ubiquinone/menaquinone biosynthesis C-methylase UbiE
MSNIQHFYDENVQAEWERLGSRHRTEFSVSLQALREFLPPAPATLIDIGGGPGRYALTLAEQGYTVTLVDLSPANLALAQQKDAEAASHLQAILQANALDLSSFPAESFDAALLMGPLYHLLEPAERLQALREAHRLLKPGGVLVAAFISRFAPLRDSSKAHPEWLKDQPAAIEQLLTTGAVSGFPGFTDAYFAHPDEIVPLCQAAGFETLGRMGCEGVVAGNEQLINQLCAADFEQWAELNYRISQDPAAIGASDHILYIGRKR